MDSDIWTDVLLEWVRSVAENSEGERGTEVYFSATRYQENYEGMRVIEGVWSKRQLVNFCGRFQASWMCERKIVTELMRYSRYTAMTCLTPWVCSLYWGGLNSLVFQWIPSLLYKLKIHKHVQKTRSPFWAINARIYIFSFTYFFPSSFPNQTMGSMRFSISHTFHTFCPSHIS
jgi:hypothetical protein